MAYRVILRRGGGPIIDTVSAKGYRNNIAGWTVPLLPVIYNPYGMEMREPQETLSLPVSYLTEGTETVPADGFTHIFVKVLNHPDWPSSTFWAFHPTLTATNSGVMSRPMDCSG